MVKSLLGLFFRNIKQFCDNLVINTLSFTWLTPIFFFFKWGLLFLPQGTNWVVSVKVISPFTIEDVPQTAAIQHHLGASWKCRLLGPAPAFWIILTISQGICVQTVASPVFPPYLSLLPEALLLKVQAMKTVKESMDNNSTVGYRNGS